MRVTRSQNKKPLPVDPSFDPDSLWKKGRKRVSRNASPRSNRRTPPTPARKVAPLTPPESKPRTPVKRADAVGFASVTYKHEPAILRVHLEVSTDDIGWQTRLLYCAQIYLLREGKPDRRIGQIVAWRIIKPNARHPNAGDQWAKDWLRVPLKGNKAIRSWGQPLAWSLQAIWDQNGQPRPEVDDLYRDQLGDNGNEVLYISGLQIINRDMETGERFTGNNFAWQAMNIFYRLLWVLPFEFSFGESVTVLLQPAELKNQDSRDYWSRGAPADETPETRADRIVFYLMSFFTSERMGFNIVAYDVPVGDPQDPKRLHTFGRTIFRQGPEPYDQLLSPTALLQPKIEPSSSPDSLYDGVSSGSSGEMAAPLVRVPLDAGRRWVFPSSREELLAPLMALPGVMYGTPIHHLRESLRGRTGKVRIYGRDLETDDSPFPFNTHVWLSAAIDTFASERPDSNAFELSMAPAYALARVVTHMSPHRQEDFAAFADQHGELMAARLIRVALENLPLDSILGHRHELEDVEDADAAWREVLQDVAAGRM
ncbi:hypothetical protein M406DRAFT_68816 [Cryphonectria parasitica EP155]|uniref:Uncharacterized protein n=1 Tax=Cryphonectria parasitica (strain ATCC 38755 / EP155) TaxID=660469 RepID=A0A9P4Y5H5_CRYP1|nr:uncharacterized protein M406DRAFT_68816 [Cryphonectria parasitica EP155]KAF3766485.1 hypothetical protein M406DRAFT_68816 [Cryphonectria parasitica EP155]